MFPHNPSLIEDPLTDDEQEQLEADEKTRLAQMGSGWPADVEKLLSSLPPRQRLFVLFYTSSAHFNGTRAAKMAGYAPDNRPAQAVQAHKLLAKMSVKKAVDRIIQLSSPSVDEIQARLSRHTQASLDECLDENGEFDIRLARKTGAIDLIESLHRQEKHVESEDGTVKSEVTWRVKMVSQQGAMNMLLRAKGAFREEEQEAGPRGLNAEEQATLDEGNIEGEAAKEVASWRAQREG